MGTASPTLSRQSIGRTNPTLRSLLPLTYSIIIPARRKTKLIGMINARSSQNDAPTALEDTNMPRSKLEVRPADAGRQAKETQQKKKGEGQKPTNCA